jgi:hypothetical protein
MGDRMEKETYRVCICMCVCTVNILRGYENDFVSQGIQVLGCLVHGTVFFM